MRDRLLRSERVRVVFFGTPDLAVIALDALRRSRHDLVGIVTRPDRPRGRSGSPIASPVAAASGTLCVLKPESPKDQSCAGARPGLCPDCLAVVAYGHLPAREVREGAPAINAHLTLLPRFRGAAPVQRAILAGERETGVTTFLLEPAMDAGPILLAERVEIEEDETAGELLGRLAPIGADLLVRSLDGVEDGSLEGTPQEASLATPAPKVRPEEAELDWTRPAVALARAVRAFNPAPGAWTTWNSKRLKIWRARPVFEAPGAPPGTVLGLETLDVATGDGVLRLTEVQPEGAKRMPADAFLRGRRRPAVRLGPEGGSR